MYPPLCSVGPSTPTHCQLVEHQQQQQQKPSEAHEQQQSQQGSQLSHVQQAHMTPGLRPHVSDCNVGQGRPTAANSHVQDLSDIDCFDW